MSNDIIQKELTRLQEIATPWMGLSGKLWTYNATHLTLDVIIEAPRRNNLHIICEGVMSVTARTYWDKAYLQFLLHSIDYHKGGLQVVDKEGGLKVVCNLIRLESRKYGSDSCEFLDEVSYFVS